MTTSGPPQPPRKQPVSKGLPTHARNLRKRFETKSNPDAAMLLAGLKWEDRVAVLRQMAARSLASGMVYEMALADLIIRAIIDGQISRFIVEAGLSRAGGHQSVIQAENRAIRDARLRQLWRSEYAHLKPGRAAARMQADFKAYLSKEYGQHVATGQVPQTGARACWAWFVHGGERLPSTKQLTRILEG